jgi:protocatechuate 3,4-dioxygenase beta subunit
MLAAWVAVATVAVPPGVAAPDGANPAGSETVPEAAAVLKGIVRGADDAPLPGATVRILARPDSDRPRGSKKRGGEIVVVESDEKGRFEATGLSGEEFTVRVEAAGHAPFQESKIPAGASLTLRLEPPQTVSGRVVGIGDGEPLPGITVRICRTTALRFGPDSCPSGKTGNEGRFTVTDLPEGRLRLTAVSERHALETRDVVTPAGDERLEIALSPGGRLSGMVVGPDGEPVEGVWIYAIRTDERQLRLDARTAGRQNAQTDETGWFEIEGLPAPGRYRFDVRMEGYAATREGPLALEPGDDRSDLVFRLTRGAAFEVRLIDTDERPVAGLEVQLDRGETPGESDPFRSTRRAVSREQIRAEDDGRFVVEHLDPGTATIYLWPTDAKEIVRESVRLRDGGSVDLGVIVVRPGLSIAGVVTDADGEPIEGATVNAGWRLDERRNRHARATADVEGRFRLSGLGDDSVNLQVAAPGFVPVEERDVEPGVDGLEFVLERPGRIFGRVVLESGTGVMGRVRGIPAADGSPFGLGRSHAAKQSQTDPNGYFEMTARAGEYVVEATAPGMKPSRVVDVEVVASEGTDVGTIVLRRGITLRGRVLRADDETPVVGAAVRVTLPGPFGMMAAGIGSSAPETVMSGSDGSFRVAGLEAGSRVVIAEHPSFASAETQVDLTEGVAPPEIVVRMSAGGTLTGTVRGRGGVVLPDVQVVATSGLDPGQVLRATTDEEGRYVLERLRPGNYQVVLSRRAMTSLAMKSAVITEGETTVLDFDEEPPITLEGRVLRGEEPLGGVGLFFLAGSSEAIAGGSMEIKTTQADDAGNYSIGLDHGGTYQVQVLSAGSSLISGEAMVELVVPDEPNVQRDIVLRTAGISGTVTTPDGDPVPGAFVTAQLDGVTAANDLKGVATARTDAEGLYKVAGLGDGIYRVTATAEGYAPAERAAVEISPATPTTIVDLVLRAGRLLRGKVIDPGGNVVQGAMVYVTAAGSPSMARVPSISDVQGRFEANVPSDDPVDVLVLAGGWAPTAVRGVSPNAEGLEVRVSRGGSVRVRVTRENGTPASGVQVRCVPADPTLAATASFNFRLPRPTDANGVTVVDLLAPGPYEVVIPQRPGVRPVAVDVRAGTQTAVELSF